MSQCCFQTIQVAKKTASLLPVPCTNNATKHGYCQEHQYAALLLEKARQYGCPELLPPMNKKTNEPEGLIIRRGLHNWQAYCERVSRGNAEKIGKRLDAEYSAMFKRGVA